MGTKSANLSVHPAICRNSKNIKPENIADGILLDRQDIDVIKKGNLSLF